MDRVTAHERSLLQTPGALHDDLRAAACSTGPVLITGPSVWAERVVAAIRASSQHDPELLRVDPPTLAHGSAEALSRRRDLMLWAPEVDQLDQAGQTALLSLMADTRRRDAGARVRVIGSSSTDLYSRVEAGEFDPDLFYQLNAIHIVAADTPLPA
jgi:hypothetical protein